MQTSQLDQKSIEPQEKDLIVKSVRSTITNTETEAGEGAKVEIISEELLLAFEQIEYSPSAQPLQRTDEWHQQRLGKLTGSRFADVLPGKSGKYLKARADLMEKMIYETLSGRVTEAFSSAATSWGTECEPLAIAAYEKKFNKVTECGFVVHKNESLVGCSPDGLICDGEGIIEVKCPYNGINHLNSAAAMPDKHIAQVQGNMWVTRTKYADFISFDPRLPEPYQLIVHRIQSDLSYWLMLEKQLADFLSEFEQKLKEIKESFNV